MCVLFYFFYLGVYEDESDGKASELYELFQKLSVQNFGYDVE